MNQLVQRQLKYHKMGQQRPGAPEPGFVVNHLAAWCRLLEPPPPAPATNATLSVGNLHSCFTLPLPSSALSKGSLTSLSTGWIFQVVRVT